MMRKLTIIALFASLPGCGAEDPPRYEVTGIVQFDGQPLPSGYIVFEPDTARGNSGPATRATIDDGRFATDGPGAVGGPHIVRIHGTDGVPVKLPGEGLDPNGTVLVSAFTTHVELPEADSEQSFVVPRAATSDR